MLIVKIKIPYPSQFLLNEPDVLVSVFVYRIPGFNVFKQFAEHINLGTDGTDKKIFIKYWKWLVSIAIVLILILLGFDSK